jgi:hypothetical protein
MLITLPGIVTLAFLLVVNLVAPPRSSRTRLVVAFGFSVLTALAGFACIPVSWAAFAVAGAALLCMFFPTRPRLFLFTSVTAILVGWMAFIWLAVVPELREWEQARPRFPFESLSSRLAYEEPFSAKQHAGEAPPLGERAKEALQEFEEEMNVAQHAYLVRDRNESLQHLHVGTVRQFVDSPGFGVGRDLRRPDPQPVCLEFYSDRAPTPIAELRKGVGAGLEVSVKTVSSASDEINPIASASADLRDFHKRNRIDFLEPGRFGYFKDRDHVAGFLPHAFVSSMNTLNHPYLERVNWYIHDIALLSLLKHEPPAAYLSENLPRMDELREAKTRPLDSFEKAALQVMRQGEELPMIANDRQIRMLGSLRATHQCVKCHEVSRGTLLGAFSYDLRRTPKQ